MACGWSGVQADPSWLHRSEQEETGLPPTSSILVCFLQQVKEVWQYWGVWVCFGCLTAALGDAFSWGSCSVNQWLRSPGSCWIQDWLIPPCSAHLLIALPLKVFSYLGRIIHAKETLLVQGLCKCRMPSLQTLWSVFRELELVVNYFHSHDVGEIIRALLALILYILLSSFFAESVSCQFHIKMLVSTTWKHNWNTNLITC